MTWVTGQKLQNGKYIIQQVLGQGGFGITYKALQVYLNRPVVIKTPNEYLNHDPEYDKYIERFIAEGQTLARLSQDPHPHIVGVIELFQEGNTHCLVMEFVPGENLFQAVKRRGALPEAEIITYIRQIGEALMVVHQAGLVHRDAHPGNIMLRSNGKAVLIDFGISKEIVPLTGTQMSKDANAAFAPYEQITRGTSKPTVDIYSLAATLYYGVTGQKPSVSLARKVDNQPLIPPQRFISGISNKLNQAILKGMALEAKDRPKSMQLWLEMLNYKPQIPNVERKVSNAGLNIVSFGKNIANAMIKLMNRDKNIVNVKIKIVNAGTNIVNAVLIRNAYKPEVVYPDRKGDKKTISNKPARTIPWSWLISSLVSHAFMGYLLTAYHVLFWSVTVVVAITTAMAYLATVPADVATVIDIIITVAVSVAIAGAVTGVASVAVAWTGTITWYELKKSFHGFHAFLILFSTSVIVSGLGKIVYQLLNTAS
jgi:serine/threonine-protein kinase